MAIHRLTEQRPLVEQLAADARTGLRRTPKTMPPKYLYDERGSELFRAITELPEYYLTRTETAILERHADDLARRFRPAEVVELGSGSSRKTRLLLEAMHRAGSGRRYVPLEISETALAGAAAALADDYPWLRVDGYLGDFAVDLPRLPRRGPRIVVFLGSTVGNLLAPQRAALLRSVAGCLEPGDAFLLGADLVKSPATLVAAYDDRAGVTAAFNRNVLTVLNRELAGDLPVDRFRHRAVWNGAAERIEMHLVATEAVGAELRDIGLPVRFAAGESLVTEYCCKFRTGGIAEELRRAGLGVVETLTDARGWFADVVAVPEAAS